MDKLMPLSDTQFLQKRFRRVLELLGHADSGRISPNILSILLPSVVLTACGGGGGGSSEPTPPEPTPPAPTPPAPTPPAPTPPEPTPPAPTPPEPTPPEPTPPEPTPPEPTPPEPTPQPTPQPTPPAPTPVDDAPTAIMLTPSTISLSEDTDTTASIKIADIVVTDADGGPRGLELAGEDAVLFELNAGQNELLLRAGTMLDFETNAALDVTVRLAADTAIADSVMIAITDVDDAPTNLFLSGATVPSGVPGWVVGRLSTTDMDSGEVYTLNHASFEVAGEFLKLKSSASISADTRVIVTVSDSDGAMTQQAFTIRILDTQDGMDRDEGQDTLTATSSGQALRGLRGSDTLIGSTRDDILDGGQHDDTLTGNDGGDVFVYRFDSNPAAWGGSGADRITDFNPAEGDKLLFIDSGNVSSLQAFKAAYSTSSDGPYQISVLDEDTANITFAGTDSSDAANNISGNNNLTIDFESNIDTNLYAVNNGQFNSIDDFITALGGEDALLFG